MAVSLVAPGWGTSNQLDTRSRQGRPTCPVPSEGRLLSLNGPRRTALCCRQPQAAPRAGKKLVPLAQPLWQLQSRIYPSQRPGVDSGQAVSACARRLGHLLVEWVHLQLHVPSSAAPDLNFRLRPTFPGGEIPDPRRTPATSSVEKRQNLRISIIASQSIAPKLATMFKMFIFSF